jgi:phosphosulfolactate phosphohydrolase-like enzyme
MINRKIFPGKINISFPWDLSERLTGPAVMFDIISASFNIIYLTLNTKELYVVTKENVIQALEILPDAALIGEVDDPILKEILKNKFIASNSPTVITQTYLQDRRIILITNNGTHTLNELSQKGANPIIIGHYANIHTVAEMLIKKTNQSQIITLIPSGGREQTYADDPNLQEDLFCAEAMRDILTAHQPDFDKLYRKSKSSLKKQYKLSGIPRQSTLDIIFGSLDKYPIIPFCLKQPNGLLKIIVNS